MQQGEGTEAQVTWEDHRNVNMFGRLNHRLHELEDEIKVAKDASCYHKGKGLPTEFFCKSLYRPQKGAFLALPFDNLGLVRFEILEAGAFGVSQSRKRAFIWAASPKETLPEWPEPMHVFASPELKISIPGGVRYAAVRRTAGGAPFRSTSVRNGASKPTIEYGSEPVSWFQKIIRGNTFTLKDHISKEMNELNFIRCQRIPKCPGADWHDLPDETVKLSTAKMVDLIPWCLPNTAKRHNQWKGLFGRLDWEGNFPTSITDPQPMGKAGMCFHPEQDRIITVHKCAPSQVSSLLFLH